MNERDKSNNDPFTSSIDNTPLTISSLKGTTKNHHHIRNVSDSQFKPFNGRESNLTENSFNNGNKKDLCLSNMVS